MKHYKLIITILILAIGVVGMVPAAMAQKQPIKICPKCGENYKGSHVCPKDKANKKTCSQCKKSKSPSSFPKNSNICSDCVAKNKKEQERKEAERRRIEQERREAEQREAERIEAERKRAEQERKEAEKREAERKKAEQERKEAEKREAERKKEAERSRIINDYVNSMVYVEGGTFKMGATKEQGGDEKPAHNVTLSSFYIGKTEVTQELWEAVMGSNPSNFKGAKRPVEYVSWDDCQEFIRKLNAKTGKNFRLPTEAEWEYAARGGNRSQHYIYSGSDSFMAVAWIGGYSGGRTNDVAAKRANELGIYDMSGNVGEWCSDWYGENYYKSSPSNNPQGPSSGSERVYRGGSWDYPARFCRVSCRSHYAPVGRFHDLGLRLAL